MSKRNNSNSQKCITPEFQWQAKVFCEEFNRYEKITQGNLRDEAIKFLKIKLQMGKFPFL